MKSSERDRNVFEKPDEMGQPEESEKKGRDPQCVSL